MTLTGTAMAIRKSPAVVLDQSTGISYIIGGNDVTDTTAFVGPDNGISHTPYLSQPLTFTYGAVYSDVWAIDLYGIFDKYV